MLRDKSFIPLSRQHQKGLALCVRIDRAQPIAVRDLAEWQAEIERLFETDLEMHFSAEEEVVFPAARQFPELISFTDELAAAHRNLRKYRALATVRGMSSESLMEFGRELSAHIRQEERLLFERMQQLLDREQLDHVGVRVEAALRGVSHACATGSDATRLRAKT
jgi:iron-sulfur cluster repair protein YtfE (RIC family)